MTTIKLKNLGGGRYGYTTEDGVEYRIDRTTWEGANIWDLFVIGENGHPKETLGWTSTLADARKLLARHIIETTEKEVSP